MTDVLLASQAAPPGAAWPRDDLESRTVAALAQAADVLDEFGVTGYTDTERPALGFGPDKVIAESAMLAYAAAGASDDPRLAAAVADVVERLVPLCRSPQALADAALNPQRAFKYAIPHRLITALGRPDDRFDRFILAQCRTARSQAGELPPVAELEREWVMGGWRQATGRPADPFDVRGTALARPVNLLTASREDAYALTHELFYVSDFARTPAPRLPRPRRAVLADVRALLARFVRLEDYDLSGELLMAWPELAAPWDPAAAFCFRVLAEVADEVGTLPCGNVDPARVAALNADEAGTYLRATGYHTAFVMGFCCAAALRAGPPPRSLPPAEPVPSADVVWPELYPLIDHRRGHWQPVFETLAESEKRALTPLLADMATLDCLEVRDYRRTAHVLAVAARGGIEGPMQRQARTMLAALGDALELASG